MSQEEREKIEQAITEIANLCDSTESLTCIHQMGIDVIERLLADEREKVREMCTEVAGNVHLNPYVVVSQEAAGAYSTAIQDVMARIRQLDLTKLDKGGEEKRNV